MTSKIHDITGQRIGQLIYNAIYTELHLIGDSASHGEIGFKLYYVSDEDLIRLVKDYIKEIET